MDYQPRFVELRYVATHLDEVVAQTAEGVMILTNGFHRSIAAIIVGNNFDEIRGVAHELREIGQSPGLGVDPYFIPFDQLRSALRHCQCRLHSGSAVIMQIAPADQPFHLMGLIPITLAAELSLIGEKVLSTHRQLPTARTS